VLNDIYEETSEVDVDGLYEKSPKWNSNNQNGVILCGFFLDGGRWSREENLILDSPLRFTPLPHFLCQLVKVTGIFSKFSFLIFFLKIFLTYRKTKRIIK